MTPVDYSPPANLHVPPAHAASVRAAQSQPDHGWRTHQVRRGDTLIELAKRYDTSVAALVSRNKLSNPRIIKVGMTLQVPSPTPPRSKAVAPKVKAKASARKTPATKAGTPTTKAKAKKQTPARAVVKHTVTSRETLSSIGRRYGVGWSAIMKANQLSDPHRIRTGQVLRVPVASTKSPAKASPKSAAATSKSTNKPKTGSATFLGRTYPSHVVASAAKNRDALRQVAVPNRAQTRDLIVRTARRYGVDPNLALGIAWQESGWNQRAVSVANAVGIMQIMPATGQWCEGLVGRQLNMMKPEDNVVAGVVFLKWLTTHASNRDQAIAGYYQGLGGVRKNGMYPDTKAYVRSVKAHMSRF